MLYINIDYHSLADPYLISNFDRNHFDWRSDYKTIIITEHVTRTEQQIDSKV